jgi:hypothetical protein
MRLLLTPSCEALRRRLTAQAWVVLEDLWLCAEVTDDGPALAPTSTRAIAGRLGVQPGTVASALQVLRAQRLVALERASGPAGRFGLAVYALADVDGLELVRSGAAVQPRLAAPCVEMPRMEAPRIEVPATVVRSSVAGVPAQQRGAPAGGQPIQGELGLGEGTV